jgi:hypothetical protein
VHAEPAEDDLDVALKAATAAPTETKTETRALGAGPAKIVLNRT